MGEYYCPNCNADLDDQIGFDPSNGTWTCTECGQFLMDDDIADGDSFEGVAWFCDNCNALLNRQSGFSDSDGTWTCTECGHINGITDEDILEDEHTCPNCGANLKKQYDYSKYSNEYTCTECGADLYRDYSDDEFDVIDEKDKCPNCGAFLKKQSGYSDYDDDWTCSECNTELHRALSSDAFSIVEDKNICPNCGSSLLKQSGYREYSCDWTCTECEADLYRDYSFKEFNIVNDDDDEDDIGDNNEDDIEDDTDDEVADTVTVSNYSSYAEKGTNIVIPSDYNQSDREYSESLFTATPMLSKSEVRKKRIKAFIFKKKRIPIGYSSDILKTKSAEDVYAILHNCGFKHIKQVELKDIYVGSNYIENEIDKVELNGQANYAAEILFPYDATVIITIHKKREISIPYNSSSLRRLNYNEVCSRLSSLGFTEIKLVPIKDLVIGLLTKNGAVEKVLVNGSKSFKKNTFFKYDTDIIVYYHTFKKG
ncbi:hypothetical protein [Ruminococcus flavefaciens]|uniref:Uncharacterized protein n=1 Tax=Ruminococcus flavefaciens TaxID=1265 RepID=A0A315XYE3_RUMFL|nr:hypothetical protein [Ruminococcus flavefaciens]PWJ12206.1 hypothetical protein IE37_01896 [Ruminococcus flavefaciens]SSA49696.1 hypothetical protein SAMN02910325_01896 [Ruminococcus flavefaciens]